MKLRRLAVFVAFALITVSQCTEARHSIERREVDDEVDYDELQDGPSDGDTQNDTELESGATREPEIPATILTAPSHFNATVGNTIILPCNVTPDSTVVQWYRDNASYFIGNMKLGTMDSRLSIAPDSKDLIIKDVKVSDIAVYRCETMPQHSAPVGINHNLMVYDPPNIISFEAVGGSFVSQGSELVLICNVTGFPPPQIMWSKIKEYGNERLQAKDGNFTLNTVSINNVQLEHAGTYLCYALNEAGHSQKALNVVVFGQPRVHVHKTVVNSDLNVEAVLQCAAREDPSPHIRWYKDGSLIEDSSSQFVISTSGSKSNLIVVPSADTDFGTFTCEAENVHGKHNRTIELVQSPVVENLEVDGSKLSWTIHSYQPLETIEVQLRDRNGDGDFRQLSVPVPETRDHKYEVVFMLADKQLDAGKYEVFVKAKNSKSWSHTSDPALVDIEAQQLIQHASVYRGNGNIAHSIRPTTTSISTILMYLLVRML